MALKINNIEIPTTGSITFEGNSIKIVNYNGTQVWKQYSPGVSATLSLTLPSTNLMVWAYWNGSSQNECFYASENYGLYISDIVSNFIAYKGGEGYTASYSGSTINIASPQAIGGNCNGQYLRIEYRSSFTGNPDYVYTATLSGGSNAG